MASKKAAPATTPAKKKKTQRAPELTLAGKHAVDLEARRAAFHLAAKKYRLSDGTYDFKLDDDESDDDDAAEPEALDDYDVREALQTTYIAIEHEFPKPEFCTTCYGTGGTEETGACDDCMCGACGNEKWACGGC